MPHRVRLPRLSRPEVDDLVKAHGCLVAADRALRESGWKGAPAVLELLGIADALIARLFNKCEDSLARQAAAGAGIPAQDASPEGNPGESAGYGQFASPAKGEA